MIAKLIKVLEGDHDCEGDFNFRQIKSPEHSGGDVAGYARCDFLKINEIAKREPNRYFNVIEKSQYCDVANEMLWCLLKPFFYKSCNSDFLHLVAHMGVKGAMLSMRLLMDAYVDAQTQNTNKDLLFAIINAKTEHRRTLLMGTLAYIIFTTSGALELKTGNPLADSMREAKVKLLEDFACCYESDCRKLSFNDISFFFQLNSTWDKEQVDRAIYTGMPCELSGCYSDALMLVCRLGIELDPEQVISLILGAMFSNDSSRYWTTGPLPTLSLYITDALYSVSNTMSMWEKLSYAMRQYFFRESRQYYLGAPGTNRAAELFLCAVPGVIEKLIAGEQMEEACKVWYDTWNYCLTALYSWAIPSLPFHIVQFLFVYKVVNLSPHIKDFDNYKLLLQLPFIRLMDGRIENVAMACLKALAQNLPDKSTLKDNEPKLLEKLINLEHTNVSSTLNVCC